MKDYPSKWLCHEDAGVNFFASLNEHIHKLQLYVLQDHREVVPRTVALNGLTFLLLSLSLAPPPNRTNRIKTNLMQRAVYNEAVS